MPSKWCLLWIFNLHKAMSSWFYKITHSPSNMLPLVTISAWSVKLVVPLLWLLTVKHTNWHLQSRNVWPTFHRHRRVKEPLPKTVSPKCGQAVEGGDWRQDFSTAHVLLLPLPRAEVYFQGVFREPGLGLYRSSPKASAVAELQEQGLQAEDGGRGQAFAGSAQWRKKQNSAWFRSVSAHRLWGQMVY